MGDGLVFLRDVIPGVNPVPPVWSHAGGLWSAAAGDYEDNITLTVTAK